MGKLDKAILEKRRVGRDEAKYFSAQDANRSLVLVAKIVKDILTLYCRAKALEEQYSVLDRETERVERKQVKKQYEAVLRQLQAYSEELSEIGCQLRDWQTGVVNWPALYQGHEVYLCWRMGEPKVRHYQEAYDSFAARKDLPEDFN
jgi:hypothetical protein